MNAEQKQRAADLLQELVDAPEVKPAAWVLGYYAGYLSITTVDGRVLPTGTALYLAPPASNVPEPKSCGWIRAIDEAMVTHHLGVADIADDYEAAKKKLNALLCLNQDIGEYFSAKAPPGAKWRLGDLVQKVRGSKWRGKVVGFYSTEATPIGYSVESAFEPGSVQVWPEAALVEWDGEK